MTAHPVEKRKLKQKAGNWLYGIIFKPGWPRWVLLGLVVLLFLLSALAVTGGTDYREDPSALAPRSAQAYVETNTLDPLLRTMGTWRLWNAERRSSGQEQYNQIQVDIGGLLSERVAGLGTLPLRWIAAAGKAAYCVNNDENDVESWALFLQVGDPVQLLSELLVDQGLRVETVEGTQENGIVRVTGQGDGALYLGLLQPGLIVSSADTLPKFAFASVKRPAFSLASSGLLPGWKSGAAVRGVYNPAYHAAAASLSAYSIVAGWMAPDMRINFISPFRNGVETTMNAEVFTDKVKGGGLWPLVWILLLLVALVCLVVAFAIVLAMIGWGGWLKVMAMRAGIMPAPAPLPVDPSPAFKEDAGMTEVEGEVTDGSGTTTQPTTDEQPAMPPEPAGDAPDSESSQPDAGAEDGENTNSSIKTLP
jgi:hypothetical protein